MPGEHLRHPNRYITDHDAEGKAIFNTSVVDELDEQVIGVGDKFFLGYTTDETPVELSNEKDLNTYKDHMVNKPGVMIPGGTVLRFVDMKPGGVSPMHRTVSLDYGVVIEGEVILRLDSGEERLLKRGDVAIQRGTMHAWVNGSQTEWARMMYVLQEAKPILVNGKPLGEDYGVGMEEVRPSGNN